MISTCKNTNWSNPSIYENYENGLESIDTILRNLKSDKEYYNHGSSSSQEAKEMWMNEERF